MRIEYRHASGRQRILARHSAQRLAGIHGFDGVIDEARSKIAALSQTASGIVTGSGSAEKVSPKEAAEHLMQTVGVMSAMHAPLKQALAEGRDVEDLITEYNVRANSLNDLMRALQSAIKASGGGKVKMPYMNPVGTSGDAVQFGIFPLVVAAIGPIAIAAGLVAATKLGVAFGKKVKAEVTKAHEFVKQAGEKLASRVAESAGKSLLRRIVTPTNVVLTAVAGVAIYGLTRPHHKGA